MKLIENRRNHKYLSVASLWEITVKINIGKLFATRDLKEMYNLIRDLKIRIIDIKQEHLHTYLALPLIHKNPFDRLIIAQASTEELSLITDDQHQKLSYFNT
ncbi:type II toxin-antitoxin system VapC family toxin [Pedobacter sp.]|uniref:type II toxin-antitoxin system VapC family toxin n=1 Tax=Pedobacter sp. TaxID=1411316 RepID=UPI003BAAE3EA